MFWGKYFRRVTDESMKMNSESSSIRLRAMEQKKPGSSVIVPLAAIAALLGICVSGCSGASGTETKNATPAAQISEETKDNTGSKKESEASKSYLAIDVYENIEKAFEDDDSINLKISEKARQFLRENDELFPAKTASISEDLIDRTLDVRSINKNSERYGDRLIALPYMYVNQITETEVEPDKYFTELIGWDESEQIYYVMFNDEVPDVFQEDEVSVIGLPLCSGSYTNTGNGQTLAIYLAACTVEKYGAGTGSSAAAQTAPVQTGEAVSLPGDGKDSRILGNYFCEYNRSTTYAKLGFDDSKSSYYMDLVKTYVDGEGAPDEIYHYTITTSDGYSWRATDGSIQIAFDGSDSIHLFDTDRDETLQRMPAGYEIPEVSGVPESTGTFLLPDSDSRYLKRSDVEWMDDATLRLAVNEIFARRGRRFNSQDLQSYFDSQPWYHGTIAPEDFNDQILNSYEKENADMISEIQEQRKKYGTPTDPDAIVYYYQSTTLATGETVNDNLDPVTLKVNSDGTAAFTGLGKTGILTNDDEYYYAGWLDNMTYVMVAKFGITVEEGDRAYYFER